METKINVLASSDYFFYYDTVPIKDYNRFDLWRGIVQPSRSMYYNRSDGVGLNTSENSPNTYLNRYFLIVSILQFGGRRNDIVTNGQDDYPDRRIFYAASTISVNGTGPNIDIRINYLDAIDYTPINISKFTGV